MTVHVLLVHYQTPELLLRCVDSVLVHPDTLIHVWDNGSAPDRWVGARDQLLGLPRVVVHESPDNLGFGPAVNRVAERLPAQDGDRMWILNPDTVVRNGALDQLLAALDSGEWDIVSPVITFQDPPDEVVWYAGGDVDIRRGRVTHRGLYGPVPAATAPFTTVFTTGAAALLSVALWRELGGFREDLFLYWEDVEWSLRAQHRGLRQAVVPLARVWHAVGASTAEVGKSTHYYYYNARNRVLVLAPPRRGRRLAHQLRTPYSSLHWIARAAKDPMRSQSLRAAALGVTHGFLGRSGKRP